MEGSPQRKDEAILFKKAEIFEVLAEAFEKMAATTGCNSYHVLNGNRALLVEMAEHFRHAALKKPRFIQ